MSNHDDENERLGSWKLVWLQLKRFQRDMIADRAERQAAPAARRSEHTARSYKAQQLAGED